MKNKTYKVALPLSILLLLIFFILNTWKVYLQPTGDMGLTIPKGSKLISQKYYFSEPKRDDIVIFQTKNILLEGRPLYGDVYVKRLIGLPGDKIEFNHGNLLINGTPYLTKIKYHSPKSSNPRFEENFTVPQNHYFVLGDNTENSLDSRHFGAIPVQNVWAKMIHVIKK